MVTTIYIEYAIIDNMVINCLLFYFVFKTIKQSIPKLKILIASIVGTGFAIALPLLSFNGVAMIFIRLFIGAFLVYIVQNKSLGRWTLFYLLFLTYTFAFGGAVYGVLAMTGLDDTRIPVGLVAGTVFSMFLILKLLVKFLNVRHSISQNLRDVVITHKGEKFKVTSYLDTGNRLVDPETNAPVVIISLSLFLKMFPDIPPDKIVLNRLSENEIQSGKYIPLRTVAGKTKIWTFASEKLEIIKGKTHENIRLGVSMQGFKDAIKYDALLHSSLGG